MLSAGVLMVERAKARKKGPAVLRITRSPLNKAKWCLDLACGHEQWITSNETPRKTTMHCRTCEAAEEAKWADYEAVGHSGGHTWIVPKKLLLKGEVFVSCKDCGVLRRASNKRCKGVVTVGPK